MKRITFFLLLTSLCLTGFAQQQAEKDDYEKDRTTPVTVDIIETTEAIEQLTLENEDHKRWISKNNERINFLEQRISESDARLAEVDDSIEYAESINLELNQIRSQTNDRAGKAKIDKSRQELIYLLWKLRDEKDFLTIQTDSDMQEAENLKWDNQRRNSLIAENEEEIHWMESCIAYTDGLLDSLEVKLDNLKLQLTKINSTFDEE